MFKSVHTKLKRLEIGERFIRRNPLYYSTVRQALRKLESLSLEGRRGWTEIRLRETLRSAARTPYGRRVGSPQGISDWPLLTKELLRDEPRAFQPDNPWGFDFFNARAATGGTTGLPLQLVRSPGAVAAEQVYQDYAIEQLGLNPLECRVAVLRGDDLRRDSRAAPPFWTYTLGGRRLLMSSNDLSEDTVRHYVDALRRFKPDLLWVYPTTLESLCLLLKKTGLSLSVPSVLSSSEVLRLETWDLARSLLQCRIVDRYGQAERVACAHACDQAEYRFVPGYAHVELLKTGEDETGALYEIVGTSLWNEAMPLVRYRTGDLVRLPRNYTTREIEEIGYGVRSFEGVLGRVNDVLLRADGTGVLAGINHVPRGVQRLLRLQVVQEVPEEVVLRVLPAPGFSAADREHLLSNARLKIPEEMVVRIELAQDLHRTAAGKTPFVIHGPLVRQRLREFGLGASASQ